MYPRDEGVAHLELAVPDQDRRDGAAAFIQFRLNDYALCGPIGRGLEFEHLGLKEYKVQQLFYMRPLLRAHLHEDGFPSPLFGSEAVLGKFVFHPVGVGLGQVYLVYRHYYRHARGLCVVYSLYGLRHNPIVGGHYKDHQVSYLRASRPHRSEGLVAGGIEKGHISLFKMHVVGAYVLGDAACLAGGHIRFPYGVKKRGLAVVHMAHDRHDRRPRLEHGGRLLSFGL